MKRVYFTPDCDSVTADIQDTLLQDSLGSNGSINDTNPEAFWGDF